MSYHDDPTVRLSYVCCGRVCSGVCPSCGKPPAGEERTPARECPHCGSVGCGCPRQGKRRTKRFYEVP